MKKFFYLLFIGLISLSISCSKDDDSSSSLNETGQKLIGKWYFTDPSTNPTINNTFTFSNDGKVVYRYWSGSGTSYDSENGTFTVDGDKMTMKFPATVTLTYIQKVVFITNTKVKFVDTGNPNEEPYVGTYYKAN